MIEARTMERWIADIANGDTDEPAHLTSEERTAWRKIRDEIAAAKAKGWIIDIPSEVADVGD